MGDNDADKFPIARWLIMQLLEVKLISCTDEDFEGISNVTTWWNDRIKQARTLRLPIKHLESGYASRYPVSDRSREYLVAVFSLRYKKGQNSPKEDATGCLTAGTIEGIITGATEKTIKGAKKGARKATNKITKDTTKEATQDTIEDATKEATQDTGDATRDTSEDTGWKYIQVSRENLSLSDSLLASRLTPAQGFRAWQFWPDVKLRLSTISGLLPLKDDIVNITADRGFVGCNQALGDELKKEWESDEEPPKKRQRLDTSEIDSGIGPISTPLTAIQEIVGLHYATFGGGGEIDPSRLGQFLVIGAENSEKQVEMKAGSVSKCIDAYLPVKKDHDGLVMVRVNWRAAFTLARLLGMSRK